MGARKQRQLAEPGGKAPDFALEQAGGARLSLAEILRDGPAVLAFFKTTCPTCQLTFPFLGRLAGEMRIFGVSQDGEEDTREFAAEYGVEFPMLFDRADDGYTASNDYGVSHVPSLFVIEQNGTIAASWDGFSKADMEALGRRANTETFQEGESVPVWKPG